MPKITIRERDLTSSGITDVSVNTVYIPGYANIGPINTPILCETLDEFQMTFGTEPYVFRAPQLWPTKFTTAAPSGNFYEKGEFEKSYIMACELLKAGLPVLYERVFKVGTDNANKTAWTAKATISGAIPGETSSNDTTVDTALIISATTPGLVMSGMKIALRTETKTINDTARNYYILTLTQGDSKYKVTETLTYFTFDPDVAALGSAYKLAKAGHSLIDNSGLLLLTFDKNCTSKITFNTTDTKLTVPNSANAASSDEFNVSDLYEVLAASKIDGTTQETTGLYKLLDKGEYVIKFITTGAYPIFEYSTDNALAKMLAELAANRGDCTALIDHTPKNDRNPVALVEGSLYKSVKNWANNSFVSTLGEDIFTYAAMFTPYGVYDCSSVKSQLMLPASFGYLLTLAQSIKTNANWVAVAGVQRGRIPNLLSLSQTITNAIADSYQPRDAVAINPITNIKPYGLTIWGNRTLKNNETAGDLTATSFLSIRQLTSDVKRNLYVAAKTLTFEQNSDILWINFKSKLIPVLDQMVSGSGLSGYEIIKQATKQKATIKALVRLYAIEAVEDWDITVELTDSSTEITG